MDLNIVSHSSEKQAVMSVPGPGDANGSLNDAIQPVNNWRERVLNSRCFSATSTAIQKMLHPYMLLNTTAFLTVNQIHPYFTLNSMENAPDIGFKSSCTLNFSGVSPANGIPSGVL